MIRPGPLQSLAASARTAKPAEPVLITGLPPRCAIPTGHFPRRRTLTRRQLGAASRLTTPTATSPHQLWRKSWETRIDEIADGIYRLSTFVPDIAPPAGFTFNQFLIVGDEPLLFHTGLRKMFPLNRAAVAPHHAAEDLRWIAFGHYEADECGAMNEWLAVAPHAQVAHGQTGCMVSLNDMADRAPRVLADGEIDRPRRRQARPLHRHAAYAARLGRRRDVRGDRPAR